MLANKCSTNCSNNKLASPSPTPAEPRKIIGTTTKVDLFEERKVPNSKLSESKKIRKYGKTDLCRERKNQIQNFLNLRESGNMVKQICVGKRKNQIQMFLNLRTIRKCGKVGRPPLSRMNKSKSTFRSPGKRKQKSKSNKANNRLPEIYKSLTSFNSNEYLDILPFHRRLLLKRPRVKIK